MRPDGVLIMVLPFSRVGISGFGFIFRLEGTLRLLVWPCAIGPVIVPSEIRAIMEIVNPFKISLLVLVDPTAVRLRGADVNIKSRATTRQDKDPLARLCQDE